MSTGFRSEGRRPKRRKPVERARETGFEGQGFEVRQTGFTLRVGGAEVDSTLASSGELRSL